VPDQCALDRKANWRITEGLDKITKNGRAVDLAAVISLPLFSSLKGLDTSGHRDDTASVNALDPRFDMASRTSFSIVHTLLFCLAGVPVSADFGAKQHLRLTPGQADIG
jgi:hypothetical protein